MNTDLLAQKKEMLRMRAAVERIEISQHVSQFRSPVSLLSTGASIAKNWRGKTLVGSAIGLLVSRTSVGARFTRALRWAGYGYAALQTYRLVMSFQKAAKK